jgi:hypothetical protein
MNASAPPGGPAAPRGLFGPMEAGSGDADTGVDASRSCDKPSALGAVAQIRALALTATRWSEAQHLSDAAQPHPVERIEQ